MSSEDQIPPLSVSPAPIPTLAPPVDLVRDRIRVVMDRVIYAAALVSLVYLAKIDKLDVGTATAVLLVSGVRPHNLFEAAAAARGNGNGNGRAAVAVILAPMLESLRTGTWLGR